MTRALLDIPRCLKVEISYVGPPRVLAAPQGAQRSVWADASPSGGTATFRQHVVLECLDTSAVLRAYREPLEGETWLIPAASERRLLAQVNAIIALGPQALAQVSALALDPDVPDPGRVFAALLVLGCVEGRDWLASARDIFVATALRNPVEMAAAVEALSLAPHADLPEVLAPLLVHERPRVRAGTIRVLAFRGVLAEKAWSDAMDDPDPTVVMAAACAPLRGYECGVCERALQPLLAQRDAEALARVALRAGLSLKLKAAHDRAVQIVRTDHPSWADAARCLAMFGCLGDASHIREVLRGSRPQDGVGAAAILGSVDLVPDLLDLLHRSDLTVETGIQVKQSLAAITGLAFESAPGAAQASRLWAESASNFDSRTRYRHGRPFGLEGLLQSLRAGIGSRDARQHTYLEMLAATESRVPRFSPYDFVGVQAESLRRIEQWLADLQGRRPITTH